MQRKPKDADEVGRKPEQGEVSQLTGSERARDEQREDGGPRYGGEAWKVADERGDNRFGKARNDDADPLEQMKRGQEDEEQEILAAASAEDPARGAAGELRKTGSGETVSQVESGGEAAGMGRGEKPRKPKSRARK